MTADLKTSKIEEVNTDNEGPGPSPREPWFVQVASFTGLFVAGLALILLAVAGAPLSPIQVTTEPPALSSPEAYTQRTTRTGVLADTNAQATISLSQSAFEAEFFHPDTVPVVAVSPDGALAVTGGGGLDARLWDLQTFEEIRRFDGHNGTVVSAAFNSDGTQLVTGGTDGRARVWNVDTGEQIRSFGSYNVPVSNVAFAGEGDEILTATAADGVNKWNTVTGEDLGPPFHLSLSGFEAGP